MNIFFVELLFVEENGEKNNCEINSVISNDDNEQFNVCVNLSVDISERVMLPHNFITHNIRNSRIDSLRNVATSVQRKIELGNYTAL